MAWEKKYLNMMNQWMILKYENKGIDRYLNKKGYHLIAIYGMAIYGRHVVRDLEKSNINIAYGIDQKKMKPYKGIEILQPIMILPYADVIINTVVHDQVKIKSTLEVITNIPILSLEDIIFDAYD